MQSVNHPVQPRNDMDSHPVEHAQAPQSAAGYIRHWGPIVVTAIIVPGGIVIALLMVWRRWSQKRHAGQVLARA